MKIQYIKLNYKSCKFNPLHLVRMTNGQGLLYTTNQVRWLLSKYSNIKIVD